MEVRVLVVDDSAYNRKRIAEILSVSRGVEVVGKADCGAEALRLASQLRPDVITLDLEMPQMDGFAFLRILMARQPTPVIVVSSYAHKENVFRALDLGAVDFVAKPHRQLSPDALRSELLAKVLMVKHLRRGGVAAPPPAAAPRGSPPVGASRPAVCSVQVAPRSRRAARRIVAIAASTGGPTALLEIFGALPATFDGVVLVAQHMPDRFTKTFAERLDRRGPLRVIEARDGDAISTAGGFVCPGRRCMELVAGEACPSSASTDPILRVRPPSPSDRFVPSADRLFRSVARFAGERALGVVLTGMGDDGVDGARAIRGAGGRVIAESEQTAVIYGMPGAAVRAGVVSETLSLRRIGEFLAAME